MKIRNLYITEYKGLRDITLNFENNNNILDLVVLAGANGSGKTRVLESIYYYFEMFRSKAVSLELFYEKNENEVLENLMNTEGLTEIEKEMQKDIEYADCLRNIRYYNQDYKEGGNQNINSKIFKTYICYVNEFVKYLIFDALLFVSVILSTIIHNKSRI